jgi:hypothetical protein
MLGSILSVRSIPILLILMFAVCVLSVSSGQIVMSSSSTMLSKRGGLASATAVNETIYVFGGEQPSGTFNNNEKYDPDTNSGHPRNQCQLHDMDYRQ